MAQPTALGSAAMQPPGPLKAAVFLDRDGTIIEDADYLVRPDQARLIPGAAAALRRLNDLRIPVVIVTNQSAVARGMATESDVAAVNDRLRVLLAASGAHVDGIYYCPHHPDIGEPPYRRACDCRKPRPGLLQQAARELGLDLAASAMIGDNLRDLEAGAAAGCATLMLVRTGHGVIDEAQAKAARLPAPAVICDDLAAAVDQWLSQRTTDNQHAAARRPSDQQPASPK
jgi:D-glycero-D-manno-heptose 1,7-bisphosphate phosphatase